MLTIAIHEYQNITGSNSYPAFNGSSVANIIGVAVNSGARVSGDSRCIIC